MFLSYNRKEIKEMTVCSKLSLDEAEYHQIKQYKLMGGSIYNNLNIVKRKKNIVKRKKKKETFF